jgi:hypothetical protein
MRETNSHHMGATSHESGIYSFPKPFNPTWDGAVGDFMKS